jgi:hypothetical protein
VLDSEELHRSLRAARFLENIRSTWPYIEIKAPFGWPHTEANYKRGLNNDIDVNIDHLLTDPIAFC